MRKNIDNCLFKNNSWLIAWTKKFCNATLLYRFQGAHNSLPECSAFYEFLAQKRYNWELLVFTVAQQVITFLMSLTPARRKRVFILDEGPLQA